LFTGHGGQVYYISNVRTLEKNATNLKFVDRTNLKQVTQEQLRDSQASSNPSLLKLSPLCDCGMLVMALLHRNVEMYSWNMTTDPAAHEPGLLEIMSISEIRSNLSTQNDQARFPPKISTIDILRSHFSLQQQCSTVPTSYFSSLHGSYSRDLLTEHYFPRQLCHIYGVELLRCGP
jgi:hypothetical protein